MIRRTGYTDNFYFIAQWFPKFGVYEPAGMRYATKGGWNCHQFHANSEFYSNHSVYNVKITVPKEYIVGAGGLQTDESDSDEGGKYKTIDLSRRRYCGFCLDSMAGICCFYRSVGACKNYASSCRMRGSNRLKDNLLL